MSSVASGVTADDQQAGNASLRKMPVGPLEVLRQKLEQLKRAQIDTRDFEERWAILQQSIETGDFDPSQAWDQFNQLSNEVRQTALKEASQRLAQPNVSAEVKGEAASKIEASKTEERDTRAIGLLIVAMAIIHNASRNADRPSFRPTEQTEQDSQIRLLDRIAGVQKRLDTASRFGLDVASMQADLTTAEDLCREGNILSARARVDLVLQDLYMLVHSEIVGYIYSLPSSEVDALMIEDRRSGTKNPLRSKLEEAEALNTMVRPNHFIAVLILFSVLWTLRNAAHGTPSNDSTHTTEGSKDGHYRKPKRHSNGGGRSSRRSDSDRRRDWN